MLVRLPKFLGGPGRWQAGAIALPLGIPGDHRHRSQHRMNPGDQAQSPIPRIQADDAGAQPIEQDRPGKQGSGKGGIMDIGGREQKEQRQARAPAEQGMHPIAARAVDEDDAPEHAPPAHRDHAATTPGWARYR